MNLKWFKGFKGKEEKERFKKLALSQREVFDVLKVILEEELEASRKDSYKKDHYFMPAWSEYQADKRGEQRTLQWVIDLLPKEIKDE